MLIILLQTVPAGIGLVGTVILSIISALGVFGTGVMAVVTWRQRNWKEASAAAVTEMSVHKEAAARLREANTDLISRVAKLEAQTDLKPLVNAIHDWVAEGRERFNNAMTRLDHIHTEQTTISKALLDEVRAQRNTSEDAYRQLTNSFQAHALDDREYDVKFLGMMDSVERRLSQIAVRIGFHEWEAPTTSTASKGAS